MAKGYRPVRRDQMFLLPEDMSDWLGDDHFVWLVLDAIATVDTSAFHGGRPGRANLFSTAGQRGYDPDMLLGLLLYGYAVGHRSSRAIERLCGTDAAFRVLCAGDVPDHTVLSRFAQRHGPAFTDLFAKILAMCVASGMGRFGTVALDGTKIAANASREANRTEAALRQLAADIVEEATAVDAAEDAQPGIDDDAIPPQLRDRARRRAVLKQALASIDEEKLADASKPAGLDAARKRVDLAKVKHDKLIARTVRLEAQHAERVTAGVAHPGPKPLPVQENKTIAKAAQLLARAEEVLAARSVSVDAGGTAKVYKRNLTDPESRLMKAARTGGFIQGLNAQIVVSEDYLIIAADVTDDPTDYGSYQPMIAAALATAQKLTGTTAPIGVVLADAGYFSKDNLTAPGPNRLISPGKAHTVEKAAKTAPVHGDPPAEATPAEAMTHRLRTPDGINAYRRRAAIVEPVNSHLKDRRGLRRFARRGLAAAKAELNLAAAVTNLLRLHTAIAGAAV